MHMAFAAEKKHFNGLIDQTIKVVGDMHNQFWIYINLFYDFMIPFNWVPIM